MQGRLLSRQSYVVALRKCCHASTNRRLSRLLRTASTTATASAVKEPPALHKVLVANRGEIACRVIRTCRQWGIPTVAIYSSADGVDALHCRMADECYLVGTGPTATESYLQADAILEIAKQVGVDAIHPGYGFLSENASFSRAVSSTTRTVVEGGGDARMRFIGPPASAMEAMASKSQSKAIMDTAGVPTTPGFYSANNSENDQSDEHLLYQATTQVGFPLLIKAVSGGGGRGMRLVEREADFQAALVSCRHEALASFKDDRVLLERYLRRPRHVEVQVVADSHGNCVHLLERDCSLQRRHQKIIEEAPASDLPLALRAHMGDMAKLAATAVGYVSAGTVEFLVDTTAGSPENPPFYFCEMNTRLQVEHPITELVTGIDLVEWQLRIAAGERLPIVDQTQIAAQGHAFEARIYGEHPERNFAPATGTVWHHHPPVPVNVGAVELNDSQRTTYSGSGTTVRVDSGMQVGQTISVFYDSMMSKLITHGPNRKQALHALIAALRSYQIAGVPTNIDFLIRCAQHSTFGMAGAVTTAFLEEHPEVLSYENVSVPPIGRAAAALAVLLLFERRIGAGSSTTLGRTVGVTGFQQSGQSPWSSHWGSWRMGGASARPKRELRMHDGVTVTCTSNRDGSFDLDWVSEVDETDTASSWHINGSLMSDGTMEVEVKRAQRIRLQVALRTDVKNGTVQIRMWPQDRGQEYYWSVDVDDPRAPVSANADSMQTRGGAKSLGLVPAPMPGKISRIHFGVGDTVQAGDVVVVLEAMKMEHAVSAPMTGVMSELRCQAKDVVDDGAILFCITDAVSVVPTSSTA